MHLSFLSMVSTCFVVIKGTRNIETKNDTSIIFQIRVSRLDVLIRPRLLSFLLYNNINWMILWRATECTLYSMTKSLSYNARVYVTCYPCFLAKYSFDKSTPRHNQLRSSSALRRKGHGHGNGHSTNRTYNEHTCPNPYCTTPYHTICNERW